MGASYHYPWRPILCACQDDVAAGFRIRARVLCRTMEHQHDVYAERLRDRAAVESCQLQNGLGRAFINADQYLPRPYVV